MMHIIAVLLYYSIFDIDKERDCVNVNYNKLSEIVQSIGNSNLSSIKSDRSADFIVYWTSLCSENKNDPRSVPILKELFKYEETYPYLPLAINQIRNKAPFKKDIELALRRLAAGLSYQSRTSPVSIGPKQEIRRQFTCLYGRLTKTTPSARICKALDRETYKFMPEE